MILKDIIIVDIIEIVVEMELTESSQKNGIMILIGDTIDQNSKIILIMKDIIIVHKENIIEITVEMEPMIKEKEITQMNGTIIGKK